MLRDHTIWILDGDRTGDEGPKVASLGGKPRIIEYFRHENVVGTGDDIGANTRSDGCRREAKSRYGRSHQVEGLGAFVLGTT